MMPRLRWTVILLCFLANTINYVDRANLAVATPYIRKELGLDAAAMGLILSGFFWTYSVMQLPAGWLIDRIGARIAFAGAVVWWSGFTVLTAVARSLGTMMGARLALGIGEAGAYPSMAKVTSLWFPTRERALASAIFDSGSRVGAVVSLPIVTWIISISDWETSFVVTGIFGVIWAIVWVVLYRDPERHPGVRPERLAQLRAARGASYDKSAHVPWASLFRYRTIWGMMLGFFCLNFVIYFFITWFPTYLVQARGFSLAKLGTLGTIPGLVSIPGGWLGGFMSDWLYRRGWSLTAARKTCLVGGMLTSSVITGSAFVGSVYAALALFAIAYSALAFTAASIWSLPGDVAPTRAHVASIGGIQNFASNLAGIVTTTFTGVMLTITSGSFVIPLVVAGALALIGAAMYLFVVGRIEPLPVPQAAPPPRARVA
jgi:ACS family D-galactonate transporter-like MFS transporter